MCDLFAQLSVHGTSVLLASGDDDVRAEALHFPGSVYQDDDVPASL
jgi:subtilase family serine protease